jgi:hypothetical protein
LFCALSTQCCLCLSIVHYCFPLQFSLMFIHQTPGNSLCPVLMANYKSRCTILQSFLYIFFNKFKIRHRTKRNKPKITAQKTREMSNTGSTKIPGCPLVLAKGKQFLLLIDTRHATQIVKTCWTQEYKSASTNNINKT